MNRCILRRIEQGRLHKTLSSLSKKMKKRQKIKLFKGERKRIFYFQLFLFCFFKFSLFKYNLLNLYLIEYQQQTTILWLSIHKYWSYILQCRLIKIKQPAVWGKLGNKWLHSIQIILRNEVKLLRFDYITEHFIHSWLYYQYFCIQGISEKIKRLLKRCDVKYHRQLAE